MKRILLFLLSSGVTLAGVSQAVSDSVSIGAGYANQVWYSLENGIKGTASKSDWDLAFEISGFAASIRINHAAGNELWGYPNGDTADWNNIDTTGMTSWIPVFNSIEAWELGAFNVNYDPSNANDLGWGVYNSINHHVVGDSLYVLKTATGDYKKLWIISLASGTYNFKLANLDGSAEITRTVVKGDFPDKNFAYYSISADQNLDREPIDQTWDLLFTQYGEYYPGFGQQNATGIFQNKGLEAAKVYPVDDKETFDDYQGATFSANITTIGRGWKTINYQTFEWEIADSTVYFAYAKNGKLWKLVMRGFGGSADGKYVFTKEEVELVDTANSISAIASQPAVLQLYPNPSAGGEVSVVYDLLDRSKEAQLIITDLQGRPMVSRTISGVGLNIEQLSTQTFPAGVYLVSLRNEAGLTTQKLIIQ